MRGKPTNIFKTRVLSYLPCCNPFIKPVTSRTDTCHVIRLVDDRNSVSGAKGGGISSEKEICRVILLANCGTRFGDK